MSMEAASIAQHCQTLRLGVIGDQFASLAEEARQKNHSHLHYLEALLQAEVEDRQRRSIELRLKDARLPRMKTLEEFDFAQSPHIPASRIRTLAEGGYLQRSEPVLLVGEPGTGKTHLATGLAIAACRQRRRVRFTTAAALVNQLVEAQREQSLSRMLARWSRVELIVIDELGYVPLAEVAAELLFQVIAERAEKAAIIVTTNLPFSEWPQVFTNARLCKAVLDRLTDPKHVSTSYVERQNLTMRMSVRRFTRLTNRFSKKFENHAHQVAVYFFHYNFCRVHSTLRVTPAMEAGLTDHIWTLEELCGLLPERKPNARIDKELVLKALQKSA